MILFSPFFKVMSESCGDKKRVLVTGATGLLGRQLVKAFNESGKWECLAVGNSRAKGAVLRGKLVLWLGDQLSQNHECFVVF